MSWSPDLYIGELRPWPDSVHVVRGNTDETRRYFPERKDGQEALERRIDELCSGNQRLLGEVMSLEAALEGMHIINDRYRADHAKLTEFAEDAYSFAYNCYHGVCEQEAFLRLRAKRNELRELGIEAD